MGRSHPTLELQKLRLRFEAHEQIKFPAGKSANTLRGAMGAILRSQLPAPEYAALFEPGQLQKGPSGLRDFPRPFVFRAAHLDGRAFDPGQCFHFDLHLFNLKSVAHDHLISAFVQLAAEGLGTGRKKVELVQSDVSLIQLPLSAPPGNETQLTIRFVTPTELKSDSRLVDEPRFGVLMARVRDRIATLCELYGEGAPPIDFKAFGERAALVRMTRCDVHPVEFTRRSSRTGQVHSIGGFVGEADYEGALNEFIPWLKAAWWTGVGRQTVWGKGIIEVSGSR